VTRAVIMSHVTPSGHRYQCIHHGLTRRLTCVPVFVEAQAHLPLHSCTAHASQWLTQDTLSSQVNLSGSSFDTLLAAYTGTAVNALMPVASNDNCTTGGGSPGASCVAFTVSQGTVYSVQVDGVNGARGNVSITVVISPSNDAFSSPTALKTLPVVVNLLGATLEAGEPTPSIYITRTVWYRIFAASNGQVFSSSHSLHSTTDRLLRHAYTLPYLCCVSLKNSSSAEPVSLQFHCQWTR
jgi:hypothetical protein